MSWMRFTILVLIAFGGFAYSGPAQPLVRALATVWIAASAAEGVLGQRAALTRAVPTHTEFVVETMPGRLLESYGQLADILRDPFLHSESKLEGSPDSWEEWRFVFFGPPGTRDTIVWSDRHKTMRSDERLIFDMLWQGILKVVGDPEEEPALVFELSPRLERGLVHRGGVYRMYLEPRPRLLGPDEPRVKPTVLAYFPAALLMDNLKEKDRGEIAKLFDLREVKQDTDTIEDAFGDLDIYHPEGGPYRVYENDLFKFKVQHYWSGA